MVTVTESSHVDHPVLVADKVSMTFNAGTDKEVIAFRNISFELGMGETLAIVGPSGCGKSTLFNIIAGLLVPTGGAVHVDGAIVSGAQGHVGYMLQKDLLLPWRNVLDNVTIGLEVRGVDQVTARRHHELTTFGLLAEVPIAELHGYIDQLTQQHLLLRTDGLYPVLQLTEDGVRALKGQLDVALYRQPRPTPGERRRRPDGDPATWEGVDRGLFEALRQCRKEVAQARGVPPYVVFHDNTLRDLARRRPTTTQALLDCYGIGARKAEDLGPIVLDVIRDYQGEADVADPDDLESASSA